MLPSRRINGQFGLTDFFNDFFDNHGLEKSGGSTPAMNVKENEKEYRLEIAVPGTCKDDFNIHLNKQGKMKTGCAISKKLNIRHTHIIGKHFFHPIYIIPFTGNLIF